MSIQVKCPNGHTLKVKDKYAGQTGLCPHCQARVLVPRPSLDLSDDAIADLLGPPAEDRESLPVHQDAGHIDPASASGSSLLRSSILQRGVKICPRCKSEVRACYDLCPHCQTYFTDPSEVVRRLVSTCPHCGAGHLPNEMWCHTCGAELAAR